MKISSALLRRITIILVLSIFNISILPLTAVAQSGAEISETQKRAQGLYFMEGNFELSTDTCTTPGQGGSPSEGDPGIQKVNPPPFDGQGPITPTGVVLHWTATSPNTSPQALAAAMKARGVSVQLYIDGQGNIYQMVEKLDTKTSHARGANDKTIGIEIGAGSDGQPSTAERELNSNDVQKQAVTRTVNYLLKTFNIQADPDPAGLKGILSHHQVTPGNKDVGNTYHQTIVNAVKSGGVGAGGSASCSGGSGGDGGDLAACDMTTARIEAVLSRDASGRNLKPYAEQIHASACDKFHVSPALVLAISKSDSAWATAGVGRDCKNPGNVRNRSDNYAPSGVTGRKCSRSPGFAEFNTYGDGAQAMTWLLRTNYLDDAAKLEQLARDYKSTRKTPGCPNPDTHNDTPDPDVSDLLLGLALRYNPYCDGNRPVLYANRVDNFMADYKGGG